MPDSSIFGGWPPTPEDLPPKTDPHGDNNPPGGNDTATIPYWLDCPEVYDTCTLGGVMLPGLAQVTATTGRKLDIKQAKGIDGATITDNGSEVEDVNIVLTIWTRQQWAAYQSILPAIDPNNTKGKIAPKDIVHPITSLHNIRRVYITKVSAPQPSRLKGAFEVTIACKGWRPEPKNPVSKTNTAKKSDNSKEGSKSVIDQKYTDGDKAKGLDAETTNMLPSSDPKKHAG